jgi:hypothetical protein
MLERGDGRVLDELLGEVPVVEDSDERGGQPPALLAQDLIESNVDLRPIRHRGAG